MKSHSLFFRRARIEILFPLVCSLLPSVILTGCELGPEDQAALEDAFLAPEDLTSHEGVGLGSGYGDRCHHERYVQPEAQLTRELDLWFVTDTSGSLDQERSDIADGIDAFVAQLPAEVNYRIGVTLAHGSRSQYSGKMFQSSRGERVILNSEEQSLSQIRQDLHSKLTRTQDDWYSDGGEEGLYSLQKALTHHLGEAQAQGFFRNDAALAVVFIADENDICAIYPEGITPVPDDNHLEGPAFDRDCQGVTPVSVLNSLRAVKNNQPLVVGGIVYTDPQTIPWGGENEKGYGYLDLIDLAKGIAVDLANGNYTSKLAEIGALTSTKLTLKDEFVLIASDVDPQSLEVYVDGQAVEYSYTEEVHTVHVPQAGGANSIVDLHYCLNPEDPGTSEGEGEGGGTGEGKTDPSTGTGGETDPGSCTGLGCGSLGV